MLFSELAFYFEKLEDTSSRLSMIDILSQLFLKVDSDEIKRVTYLLEGRVAPFYEPVEVGMAQQHVASVLSRVNNLDRDEVLKKYNQIGDLGVTAQLLATDKQIKTDHLTVKEVFDTLYKIAITSGEGTVEKRILLLAHLAENMNDICVKHLIRIVVGTLRLGIGDPTILDAFAQAKLGDKKSRLVLEEAYNKTSDLGLIGEVLWKYGQSGIEKLNVEVGRPIRPQLCERLPNGQKIMEKFGGMAHVQPKLDGFRIQIHKDGDHVRLFSRNLEETTHMFPEIIEGVKKQVKAKSAIFDSEALAFNPASEEFLPFQETIKRKRKYDIAKMQKEMPLKAFVFDLMYLDGKPLIDKPLKERIEQLKEAIAEGGVLQLLPGEYTDSVKRVDDLFNDALTKGLEGIIAKRLECPYEAGARNFNWVKLKRHSSGELKDTVDCVLLGYIFGRGKRVDFGAGSLLVGVYDAKKDEFVTVTKIGTGLTDLEWREIHQRADKIKLDHKSARVNSVIEPSVWIKPEIVIEVLADEITRSPVHTAGKEADGAGYALRFPRMVKFREDKKAEDATAVDELIQMYNNQYQK